MLLLYVTSFGSGVTKNTGRRGRGGGKGGKKKGAKKGGTKEKKGAIFSMFCSKFTVSNNFFLKKISTKIGKKR
jgi:hypothetical protein